MNDQLILKFPSHKAYKKEDFYVSPSNQEAYDFINGWPNWIKRIINIFGPSGSGKSTLIDVLRDNKDPRLMKFADPVKGGTFVLTKPTTGSNVALYPKHVKHLTDHMKAGGLTITESTASDGTVTITVPAGNAATFEHYVGQPTRMNSKIKPYLYTNLFSKPTSYIIGAKNTGNPIAPKLVMTAAESHLMVAEAAIKGIGSSANAHYQMGITKSMQQWGVPSAQITAFLANSTDVAATANKGCP